MKRLTTEEFINKAKTIHGDRYDYSKTVYHNSRGKVCIICPDHGEFWQSPNSHLNGSGCPHCCTNNQKYTLDDFISNARTMHGDKYDYSQVEYINNESKVCIICPEHGEFWQKAGNHLHGQGCPKCSIEHKMLKYDTNSVVSKFKEIHGNKYDYSKVVYAGTTSKVHIICPEHGEFWQTPSLHMKGCGCPKCGNVRSNVSKQLNTEQFIAKAKLVHGNKYDYSKVVYVNYDTPVTIICPVHGEFKQTPDAHLQGKGCNSCSIRHSSGEDEIIEFIKSKNIDDIKTNDKELIKPYELDIYIPSKKIAIEYNGIRWHSEAFGKDKNYHLSKLEKCNDKGIKLIQIFEDEYLNHKEIVLHKLSHILGCDSKNTKIFARKCQIKEITIREAKPFLDTFHIQGFVSSSIYLGCYHNEQLIGVMTFKQNKNQWELTRFASDYNYICCGVGGKLLSFFIKKYRPEYIKSFADRRWTTQETNNIYTKLGFKLQSITKPEYRYVKNNNMERIHKFNLRKNKLIKKYGFSQSMTEQEMALTAGYHRIWDCGLFKYELFI